MIRVALRLVADVGQALGPQETKDKTGGRVTLTVKGKKVELLVGRSAAIINGREST
ncbi:MAG: hypothetical protein HY318_06285, partial [Armatimonadetes bacterium]|nr:hypothetical protein [Armatimonadota bacterium]